MVNSRVIKPAIILLKPVVFMGNETKQAICNSFRVQNFSCLSRFFNIYNKLDNFSVWLKNTQLF